MRKHLRIRDPDHANFSIGNVGCFRDRRDANAPDDCFAYGFPAPDLHHDVRRYARMAQRSVQRLPRRRARLADDHPFAFQVGDEDGFASREAVPAIHHHDDRIAPAGDRMESRVVRQLHDDRDIGAGDNAADPYQLRNLIHVPDKRDVAAALDADMCAHMARIGDRFLAKEQYYDQYGIGVDHRGKVKGIIDNVYDRLG